MFFANLNRGWSSAQTQCPGSLQTLPCAYAPYGSSAVANFTPSACALYFNTEATSLLDSNRHPSPCRSRDVLNVNLQSAGAKNDPQTTPWCQVNVLMLKEIGHICYHLFFLSAFPFCVAYYPQLVLLHASLALLIFFSHLCSLSTPFLHLTTLMLLLSCLVLQTDAHQQFVCRSNTFE